jgi:hypothetical protein
MPKPALVSVFLLGVSVVAAAQANTSQHVFSFNMTPPVITGQLQVEYVLRDESGQRQPASREVSSTELGRRTQVMIGTAFAGKPAKSLQAFAFYPGCQFETVTADLTTDVHQFDSMPEAPEYSAAWPCAGIPIRRQKG